jgi:transposase
MTQRDRDRLVVLKKAQKKLITQKQAAGELGLTERPVRRLLKQLKARGDKAVIHALRGKPSNRKLSEPVREKILAILSQDQYRDFGPTAASEELASKHDIRIGREALRQLLMVAGCWRAKKQKVEKLHQWRERRSCRGELVQWDTSEHDWLEGRGDKLYLIAMIDDATSELTARFALHDSTEENMRLLRDYLDKNGRPVGFYTDKASLFQTAPKVARDQKGLAKDEGEPLPPTQIGRALQELQIAWIAAHSPQAKGRIERAFATAQDRLVKGLRLAGATTLEQANQYLQLHFLPWWNETLKVLPANTTDAHRPLGPDHQLSSVLSHVESRTVGNDYTFRYAGKLYQIAASGIRTGLRGGVVRVEQRLDGSMAVRFGQSWLAVSQCQAPQKIVTAARTRKPTPASPTTTAQRTAAWRGSNQKLFQPGITVSAAAKINRTRTRDNFD